MDFTFPTSHVPPSPQPQQQQQQNEKKLPLTARATVTAAAPDGSRSTPAKIAAPTPAGQAKGKIPLAKGFSQMDWLRLMRSKPMPVRRKDIPLAEVKQHNKPDDAWMVFQGRVYDITPYLNFHPGGRDILLKAAGKDGTALFMKYHPWVNIGALMEKCLLGSIAVPTPPQPTQPSPSAQAPPQPAQPSTRVHQTPSQSSPSATPQQPRPSQSATQSAEPQHTSASPPAPPQFTPATAQTAASSPQQPHPSQSGSQAAQQQHTNASSPAPPQTTPATENQPPPFSFQQLQPFLSPTKDTASASNSAPPADSAPAASSTSAGGGSPSNSPAHFMLTPPVASALGATPPAAAPASTHSAAAPSAPPPAEVQGAPSTAATTGSGVHAEPHQLQSSLQGSFTSLDAGVAPSQLLSEDASQQTHAAGLQPEQRDRCFVAQDKVLGERGEGAQSRGSEQDLRR